MLRTHHVQQAALRLWEARVGRRMPSSGLVVDRMYEAIQEDMAACGGAQCLGGYDPESDARVAWMRSVAARIRAGESPYAPADLEATVRFVLGVDVPLLERSLARCGG
jgi:serine/threonine protein kinase HipA of HipAB toxin-antitoxin module